ncbi:MAG: hypothetical protein ABI537_16795, partial [Casimicrobiaceae bacterium]
MSTTSQRFIPLILLAAFLAATATPPAAAHNTLPATATQSSASAVTATGTVTELDVENQVTGLSLRYLGLRMDDGHSLAIAGIGVDVLARGERISATGTIKGEVMRVSSIARSGPAGTGKATAQGSGTTQLQGT